SPYVGASSFAGGTHFISPEDLAAEGLLTSSDLGGAPAFRDGVADYEGAMPVREGFLRKAWENFRGDKARRAELEKFAKEEAEWLDDWALYAALKDKHKGAGGMQ